MRDAMKERGLAESRRSTLMTLRNAGEPSGLGTMAAPMMVASMHRANQKDLERLKAILEDRQLSRTLG